MSVPGSFRSDTSDPSTDIEPVTILNLSLGGAFIAYRRIPMGTRSLLRFTVPDQDVTIETEVTVRWNDDSGIGVQFDGLRARDVWALSKYLEPTP